MSKGRVTRLVSVGCLFVGGLACERTPHPPPEPPFAIDASGGGPASSGMGTAAGGQGSQATAVLRGATGQPSVERVSDDLKLLMALVGEWRELPPAKISPTQTFRELGCDEVDVTEITIEIEKRLKIRIPDATVQAAIARATIPPNTSPFEWRGLHLTLAQFADVITASRTK